MSSGFDWDPLIDVARASAANAHSPYSKFRVGASVLAADGRMFSGCNIESASYGLTVCAERVALFAATAAGVGKPTRLAVVCLDAPSGTPGLRMPCGACRQVMADLMGQTAEIMIDGVGVRTVAELLPDAFCLSAR